MYAFRIDERDRDAIQDKPTGERASSMRTLRQFVWAFSGILCCLVCLRTVYAQHPTSQQAASEQKRIDGSIRYTSLSAGVWHGLALRADGLVDLLGAAPEHPERATPGEPLREIAAGFYASYGIRLDGTLVAWGVEQHGNMDLPKGSFRAIAVGTYHGLGLRKDGTLAHWGAVSYGLDGVPVGQFRAVAADGYTDVALREDGTLVAWGYSGEGATEVPAGKFRAACVGLAIRLDGTLAAWGKDAFGTRTVPRGKFTAIAITYGFAAAIGDDGSLVVWGHHPFEDRPLPRGPFTAVAVGSRSDGTGYLLALRSNGTLCKVGIQ